MSVALTFLSSLSHIDVSAHQRAQATLDSRVNRDFGYSIINIILSEKKVFFSNPNQAFLLISVGL